MKEIIKKKKDLIYRIDTFTDKYKCKKVLSFVDGKLNFEYIDIENNESGEMLIDSDIVVGIAIAKDEKDKESKINSYEKKLKGSDSFNIIEFLQDNLDTIYSAVKFGLNYNKSKECLGLNKIKTVSDLSEMLKNLKL